MNEDMKMMLVLLQEVNQQQRNRAKMDQLIRIFCNEYDTGHIDDRIERTFRIYNKIERKINVDNEIERKTK